MKIVELSFDKVLAFTPAGVQESILMEDPVFSLINIEGLGAEVTKITPAQNFLNQPLPEIADWLGGQSLEACFDRESMLMLLTAKA